jgi:hypothetical protein
MEIKPLFSFAGSYGWVLIFDFGFLIVFVSEQ